MLDIGWSELAVVALIAVIIVGPKDLPKVLQTIGRMMAKMRKITQEFQSGIDDMVRQAELEEAKEIIAEAKKLQKDGLSNTIDPTGVTREVEKDLKNLNTGSSATNVDKKAKDASSETGASSETAKLSAPPEKPSSDLSQAKDAPDYIPAHNIGQSVSSDATMNQPEAKPDVKPQANSISQHKAPVPDKGSVNQTATTPGKNQTSRKSGTKKPKAENKKGAKEKTL